MVKHLGFFIQPMELHQHSHHLHRNDGSCAKIAPASFHIMWCFSVWGIAKNMPPNCTMYVYIYIFFQSINGKILGESSNRMIAVRSISPSWRFPETKASSSKNSFGITRDCHVSIHVHWLQIAPATRDDARRFANAPPTKCLNKKGDGEWRCFSCSSSNILWLGRVSWIKWVLQ